MTREEQNEVLPITVPPLLLRKFVAADAEALADIEYDQRVKKYLGGLPKCQGQPEKVRPRQDWLSEFHRTLFHRTLGGESFAVWALQEGILAGRAFISPHHYGLPEAHEPPARELAIVIAQRFWGDLFGRKVAEILIPIAFQKFKAPCVLGLVHPEHKHAIELLREFNFHPTQETDEGRIVYKLDAKIA